MEELGDTTKPSSEANQQNPPLQETIKIEASGPVSKEDDLLGVKKLADAINKLIDLWSEHLKRREQFNEISNKRLLILIISLFSIMIGTVLILTLTHDISSDATGFLLGAIVTGAIATIREFNTHNKDRWLP